MQLDPAHARVEVADEHAMADDRGVIVDHGAAQADDLVAQLLPHRQQIGGDVGAKEEQVRVQRARSGKPMHRGQHLRVGFRSLHGGYHQVRQFVQCQTGNSER